MSLTPSSLPSFGLTLSSAKTSTVARDFSLPFRRDFNAPSQALSTPLSFKNPHNSRTQAIFFFADDAPNMPSLDDVDVETQSFSSVDETPLGQFYGQKIANAVLRVLLGIKSFGRKIMRH